MKKNSKSEKSNCKNSNETKLSVTPTQFKNLKKEITKEDIIKDYLRLTNGNARPKSSMSVEKDKINFDNMSSIQGYNSPVYPRMSARIGKEICDFNGNINDVNFELSKITKNLSSSLSFVKMNKSNSNYQNGNSITGEAFFSNSNFEHQNDSQGVKVDDFISELNNKIHFLQEENKELKRKLENTQEDFSEFKRDQVIILAGTEKERDENKQVSEKYLEVSRLLGEEVIILRNQLDKFLYYKK
jgi:hypothetical protein